MSTEKIRDLLELMEAHELAELELEEGDFKLRLAKAQMPLPQMVALPQSAAQAAPAAVPQAAPAEDPNLIPIKSPIVGTFYKCPSPDAEAFAKVGDVVGGDTVVCIIEAMKVMNEVKAGVSGTITKVLVENGEAVEYGQPLFMVRPS